MKTVESEMDDSTETAIRACADNIGGYGYAFNHILDGEMVARDGDVRENLLGNLEDLKAEVKEIEELLHRTLR